jgi:hypothetical protein
MTTQASLSADALHPRASTHLQTLDWSPKGRPDILCRGKTRPVMRNFLLIIKHDALNLQILSFPDLRGIARLGYQSDRHMGFCFHSCTSQAISWSQLALRRFSSTVCEDDHIPYPATDPGFLLRRVGGWPDSSAQ